jgi:hypothetical protein
MNRMNVCQLFPIKEELHAQCPQYASQFPRISVRTGADLFSTAQNVAFRPSGYNRFIDYWWLEDGGVSLHMGISRTRKYAMPTPARGEFCIDSTLTLVAHAQCQSQLLAKQGAPLSDASIEGKCFVDSHLPKVTSATLGTLSQFLGQPVRPVV